MRNRNLKIATILFFMIGVFFTSTSAFSYWREVTVTRDVELVQIGEPVQILIDDLNQNEELKQLVPFGYVYSTDQADLIVLEYEIGVSKELLNVVDLYINVENILIDGLDTYSHLVDIKIMNQDGQVVLDLYNSTITVTVEVTLIEPIDLQEAIELGLDLELVNVEDSVLAFESIKGKDITFTLNFELQTKDVVTEE